MNNKILNFIPGIVMFVIIISFLTGNIIQLNSKQRGISKAFPKLMREDSINSIVLTIHTFSGFRSVPRDVYVTLKSGKKYRIQTDYNNNFPDRGISNDLSLGDSIFKKANCDTLYIKKRDVNKTLYFILHRP